MSTTATRQAQLTQAQIVAQERLRVFASAGVVAAWKSLPAYDRANIPEFIGKAAPVVAAAQRQSAALTNAYIARKAGRQPVPLDISKVTGPAIRNGVPISDVYARPFVNVWSALADGKPYADAVASGEARAAGAAAMDVQNTMRHTLVAVSAKDPRILGYQRVPDAGACPFCLLVAGQRYRTDQLMPVHNNCGCGVDVITVENRHQFTGKPENDLNVSKDGVSAAVVEHGELGPLLVNGADHFTDEAQALAA